MSSDKFSEATYQAQYERALKEVRTLLDTKKHPNPSDIGTVTHRYEDKYATVSHLANLTIATFWQTLSLLGLTPGIFAQAVAWSRAGQSVRLRFTSEEACRLVKSVVREVESPKVVSETTGGFFGTTGRTDYIITKVTDYYFEYSVSYRFVLIPGTDVSQAIPLLPKQEGSGQYNWIRNSETLPRPSKVVNEPIDCNITWFLKHITSKDDYHWSSFNVNRSHAECWTPRRNVCIDGALEAVGEARAFGTHVESFFMNKVWNLPDQFMSQQATQLKRINSELFIPVIALFDATEDLTHDAEAKPGASQSQSQSQRALIVNLEARRDQAAEVITHSTSQIAHLDDKQPASVLLRPEESSVLIAEGERVMREKVSEFEKILESCTLVDATQATLVMVASYLQQVARVLFVGVEYIEFLIRKQLVSAIGRVMTTTDFAKYLNFNFRRFYREQYQPQCFAYSVRVAGQDAEGVVALRTDACSKPGAREFEPAMTFVRKTKIIKPMKFKINAGTEVQFYGDRYVHGLVAHQFSTEKEALYSINGRAKQFSSFILLLGKIPAPDRFDPVCAITLQNKEEIDIPLVLEAIPSAKEFKKAVESMSPEQQRFASAYRGLQLSCTLFGLVVLQINPQLERLLNLPASSLRQEIALSQQILGIFREWQVSSEIFCYDSEPNVKHTKEQQVDAVRNSVAPFLLLLEDIRRGDLQQALIEESIKRNQTANILFETERVAGIPESSAPYHYCAVLRNEYLLADGFYGSAQANVKDDLASCELRAMVAEQVKQLIAANSAKAIVDKSAALLVSAQPAASNVSACITFKSVYRVHIIVTVGGAAGSSAFATYMAFQSQVVSPLVYANLMDEVVRRVHVEFAACFHKDVVRTAKQQTFQNFFGACMARIMGKEIKAQQAAQQQREEEERRRQEEARRAAEERERQRRRDEEEEWEYKTNNKMEIMLDRCDNLQDQSMVFAESAYKVKSKPSVFGGMAKLFSSSSASPSVSSSRSRSSRREAAEECTVAESPRKMKESVIKNEKSKQKDSARTPSRASKPTTVPTSSPPPQPQASPSSPPPQPQAHQQQQSQPQLAPPVQSSPPSQSVEQAKVPEPVSTPVASTPSETSSSANATPQPTDSSGATSGEAKPGEGEQVAESQPEKDQGAQETPEDALVEASSEDESQDEDVDVTTLPTELDSRFEQLDPLGWLRPTTIEIGKVWTKKVEQKMLQNSSGTAPPQTLEIKQQETARDESFLLIDALTRSGALAWHAASLHVIVAATHCFDRSLMDTVIQRNLNPCEALEHSALIVTTTLHQRPAQQLVAPSSYNEEKMKLL